MKKNYFLLSSALLLSAPLLGHVAFPVIFTATYFYQFFSWSLVALGLIVEWACLYYVVRNIVRALYVVFVMNVASTVIGSCILFVVRSIIGSPSVDYHAMITFTGARAVCFFVIALCINVAIEYPIARYLLAHISSQRLFIAILIANSISALFGLAAIGIYYYWVL